MSSPPQEGGTGGGFATPLPHAGTLVAMGGLRKTRKFAEVKRLLNPKDTKVEYVTLPMMPLSLYATLCELHGTSLCLYVGVSSCRLLLVLLLLLLAVLLLLLAFCLILPSLLRLLVVSLTESLLLLFPESRRRRTSKRRRSKRKCEMCKPPRLYHSERAICATGSLGGMAPDV